jgi:hypothetical protein
MSTHRGRFPPDMAVLLLPPIILVVMLVALSFLFPFFNAVRHPTPAGWLVALYLATAGATIGTILLFCAKLPQYRSGIFFRFGPSHLPLRSQRLYRLAYRFIVPSCLALLILLMIASRVR